jgi:hypothetical protein
MSEENVADRQTAPVISGQCRAFINLGAFTQRGIRCSFKAEVAGYCLRHASVEQRRIGMALKKIAAGTTRFGSDVWREQRENKDRESIASRISADQALAQLVAEQERDSRINRIQPPWTVSLDRRFDDSGAALLDFIDHSGQLHLGQRCTPDFTDAVNAVIDYKRTIDGWAEELAS